MKINLFTNWYKSYRDEENEICLMANIENPRISKVYLFCDDDKKFLKHTKVIGNRFNHRPTYNDFFKMANALDQEISIIANSDIYFDDSLDCLKFLDENTCYALTRWDDTLHGCIFFNRRDSQDVWIFKNPIKSVKADFEIGKLGCDNRIAYELKQAGYRVANPSRTIKAYHLHSEVRTENENHDKRETIPPPYEYVLPVELHPFLSIVTRNYYKRTEMFKNCGASVSMQKDQDFDHIIIKDMVGVGSTKANCLFYSNKDRVRGEYVFMLDDDDLFTSDEFVGDMKKIVEECSPGLIFVRMLINEELYPTSVVWKKEKLHQNHVGTSNVVVRNDLWQKHIERFSDSQIGDFLFINSVFMEKPKIYWQDKLYSKTTRVSKGQP